MLSSFMVRKLSFFNCLTLVCSSSVSEIRSSSLSISFRSSTSGGRYPEFFSLLLRAGLFDPYSTGHTFLDRNENYTVFVPSEEAINSLSPEYREAMFLVRIRGLQIKDAAVRMNRTPQAVKHLLMRAIRKLREILGDTESFSLPPESFEGWRSTDAT